MDVGQLALGPVTRVSQLDSKVPAKQPVNVPRRRVWLENRKQLRWGTGRLGATGKESGMCPHQIIERPRGNLRTKGRGTPPLTGWKETPEGGEGVKKVTGDE